MTVLTLLYQLSLSLLYLMLTALQMLIKLDAMPLLLTITLNDELY